MKVREERKGNKQNDYINEVDYEEEKRRKKHNRNLEKKCLARVCKTQTIISILQA